MYSYSKKRTIPLAVSVWRDKDVSIRKATASSGLMPDTTRYNVFLSRKFYSDMLDLSIKRHQKIGRCDYNKKMFLLNQRQKADTTMPGLLPYIEPHTNDMEEDLLSRFTLSGNDQFKSPSFQSFTTRSIIKSESTCSQKKTSNRQQISLERINQLSQPKGHRYDPTEKENIQTPVLGGLTVQDLFGNIDHIHHENSISSNEQKTTTDDKRFRQLIHLFSEVHERAPSNIQSVKNVIQSNASLQQNDSKHWERKTTIEQEHNQETLTDSSYSKTDVYLIDACA